VAKRKHETEAKKPRRRRDEEVVITVEIVRTNQPRTPAEQAAFDVAVAATVRFLLRRQKGS
jgi:hypothetical protein